MLAERQNSSRYQMLRYNVKQWVTNSCLWKVCLVSIDTDFKTVKWDWWLVSWRLEYFAIKKDSKMLKISGPNSMESEVTWFLRIWTFWTIMKTKRRSVNSINCQFGADFGSEIKTSFALKRQPFRPQTQPYIVGLGTQSMMFLWPEIDIYCHLSWNIFRNFESANYQDNYQRPIIQVTICLEINQKLLLMWKLKHTRVAILERRWKVC